ncbi:MAG: 4Fe-4S dicluster domain-containing protein [Thermodesulfobacteriota bacterium]
MSSGIVDFLKRVVLRGENPLADNYRENRLRPPGAVSEERFIALCIRCNRCLEVCPYGSIKRAGLGPEIGTPYVLPEEKACYLCMACPRLCPTGALETGLSNPERVRMGRARINTSLCYSHLFLEHDKVPDATGSKIGALCNTCYNVCPHQDKAIKLEQNLFPVVLDDCVGCGICVERCPVRPARAINVIPAGMGRVDEAGFHFGKARRHFERASAAEAEGKALKGEQLLDRKYRIDGSRDVPEFKAPFKVPETLEGW